MSARPPQQRLIGVTVAIVLLLIIGWAATQRSGTESDRQHDSLSALRSTGIRQARVDVDGTGVTVYGVADDGHMREMALREVRDVPGVRMVTDRLVVGRDDSEPGLTPLVADAEKGPPTLAPTASQVVPVAAPPAPTSARGTPAPRQAASAAPPAKSTASTASSGDPCVVPPASVQGQALSFVEQSATLAGSSINTLAAVSRHLQACPDALLEVRAYATQGADSSANLTLSRQRAGVVVGHLSRDGVATHRLVATYRGDRSPGGDRAILTVHAGKSQ